MRILYLYCHPLPESFHAGIRDAALAGLAKAGHEIDLLDFYAEGFQPILGEEERRRYHEPGHRPADMEPYIARLQQAEGMVLQFPTWCFGPPAMLKGFLDRIILPGVAFDLSDPAHVRPMLQHIRKVAGIVTYGRPRLHAIYMGDPPRKLVTRYLRWFVARQAPISFHALYHMNTADAARRTGFIARIGHAMERF